MSKHSKISISYGYDIHSITITDDQLKSIKEGYEIEIDGQGFMHEEDGLTSDHWVFNRSPGEIMFWLDNGAEFYSQSSWIED
jgi:hypothetical protein